MRPKYINKLLDFYEMQATQLKAAAEIERQVSATLREGYNEMKAHFIEASNKAIKLQDKIDEMGEEEPDPMPFVFSEWLKSKGFDYRDGLGGPVSDLQGRSLSMNGNGALKYFNPHDVYICFNGLNTPRTSTEAETLFYLLGIS